MPFTFSHPALILPLNLLSKKWFSITALIIGSILPDLEAFLRLKSEKDQSHSWDALFWFGLPFGLILSFIFHFWVRNPFIYNLPSFFQKRFNQYATFNWWQHIKTNVGAVLFSFLLGGASHLIWDSFTHYDGVLLKLNPDWDRNTTLFGYSIEIVYVIQHVNTLIGLVIIAVAVWQLPVNHTQRIQKNWLPYWLIVSAIAAVIFMVRYLTLDEFKIDDVVVSGLTALFIGILITSFFYLKKYIAAVPSIERNEKL